MKRQTIVLAACMALAACAGTPEATPPDLPQNMYGAFAGIAPDLESQLAGEAARQLVHIRPPAENLLDFQQKIPDDDRFGQKLLRATQDNGYFIRQSHVKGMEPQCGQMPVIRKNGDDAPQVAPACYLVDEVEGLLRLTLFAAGDIWSRLFTVGEDGLRPAGAWTHWRNR
ncbi:MAG: hypothetical protein LBE85_09640 [Candidatus Accumulibacter sp.]|jgi:hypothetical protein|nr:hypothetical protein [Accumulibacter sp.]